MTREELMKMSKKELKDRLKDLGKNAQALSGQELTDAMDEARTMGEILDEIKAREDLMAAAQGARTRKILGTENREKTEANRKTR